MTPCHLGGAGNLVFYRSLRATGGAYRPATTTST